MFKETNMIFKTILWYSYLVCIILIKDFSSLAEINFVKIPVYTFLPCNQKNAFSDSAKRHPMWLLKFLLLLPLRRHTKILGQAKLVLFFNKQLFCVVFRSLHWSWIHSILELVVFVRVMSITDYGMISKSGRSWNLYWKKIEGFLLLSTFWFGNIGFHCPWSVLPLLSGKPETVWNFAFDSLISGVALWIHNLSILLLRTWFPSNHGAIIDSLWILLTDDFPVKYK